VLALARVTTALALVGVALLRRLKVVRSRLVPDYLLTRLRNGRGILLVTLALGVWVLGSHLDGGLLLDAVLRTILLYLLRRVIKLVRSSLLTRLVSIRLLVLKLRSNANRLLLSSLSNRV